MVEHFDAENLMRIFISGVLIYSGLIFLLRISGNRTLSQMNSFDFVITIAMGSTFSSGLLQKSITIYDTFAALAFLIIAQYIVSFFTSRNRTFKKMIIAEPVLLFYQGKFLKENMLKARISDDELIASCRQQGFHNTNKINTIVLESNGKLSIGFRNPPQNTSNDLKLTTSLIKEI